MAASVSCLFGLTRAGRFRKGGPIHAHFTPDPRPIRASPHSAKRCSMSGRENLPFMRGRPLAIRPNRG
ncbi:MAG: hypothetical protein CFE34_16290 [Rhodobacteraceae bacterium PARR1]|nr:MAG: hypothetical protein CFE34_16290 [Rhodobacteraceae bacterium PARR1]